MSLEEEKVENINDEDIHYDREEDNLQRMSREIM